MGNTFMQVITKCILYELHSDGREPRGRTNIRKENQRTNGPVNAHLISGPTVSTKKNKF